MRAFALVLACLALFVAQAAQAQTGFTPDSHSRGGDAVTRSGQTLNGTFAQFKCAGPGPCSTVGPGTLSATSLGGLVLIQAQPISTATPSVTFSVPTGYEDLVLVVNGRGDTASADTPVNIQFNGDTGSNYSYAVILGGSGSTVSQGSNSSTSALIGYLTAATGVSGGASMLVTDIGAYSSTTFDKSFETEGSNPKSDTAGQFFVTETNGLWKSTAAVTSFKVFPGAGNFAAGSNVSLYGRGGANVTINPAPGLPVICEVVTSGSAASVTVGGGSGSCPTIPQTYRDLQVKVTARGTVSATEAELQLQFNGDTAAHYNYETLFGFGTGSITPFMAQGVAATAAQGGGIAGATAPANAVGNSVLTIGNYATTTFNKTFVGVVGDTKANSGSNLITGTAYGEWLSTAAITQITFTLSSGNFVDGSVITVYGIGGSPTATMPLTTPQGRLTLTSGSPVMTADATAQGTIYYDNYVGNLLPVGGIMYRVGELSDVLNATAHVSTNLYDDFAYNSSGTIALCTGPAWTNSTTRSAAISLSNGIWTNSASLTCTISGGSTTTTIAPAQATYLGTFYATANGQTGMAFHPAAASGGSNAILGLWNAYNRVRITSTSVDSFGTWTFTTNAWRQCDNSASNRVTWVDGLGISTAKGYLSETVTTSGTGFNYSFVLAKNTNTIAGGGGIALTGYDDEIILTAPASYGGNFWKWTLSTSGAPAQGLNFYQCMEGNNGGGTYTVNGYGKMPVQVEVDD